MTMQDDFFGNNPFLDFLGEVPEAAFFSFQDQFGRSPNQRRFFQNQFQNIHNRFLGALGSQIRGGETPTLRFPDFLEDFDFGREFAMQPPSFRGGFGSQFNPRTRTIFGF